jgi:hypothetical protein
LIALREALDRKIDEQIETGHLVCDHVRTHHGQDVSPWLAKPPRFVVSCTPVQGSWMNHVEPGVRLLHRQRLRIVDFESTDHLRAKLEQFLHECHQLAPPFTWSPKSVAKSMAEAPTRAA